MVCASLLSQASGIGIFGSRENDVFCRDRGSTLTDRHLLDLVISDIAPRSIKILHPISDHTIVLAYLDIGIPESTLVIHKVFDFGLAEKPADSYRKPRDLQHSYGKEDFLGPRTQDPCKIREF